MIKHENGAFGTAELFDNMLDGVCLIDGDNKIQRCNRAVIELLKKPSRDIVGHTHLELFHNGSSPEAYCPLASLEHTRTRETVFLRNGGRWVSVTADPILDLAGNVAGAVHVFTDITELKQAEQALLGTNRSLRVLSKSNQILVRSVDETDLLQQVCRALVESGGYRLAWVGFAEDDPKKTVRPVAQAGGGDGYLETITVTWAGGEFGRGPVSTAIRTGKPSACQDVMGDPSYRPWRDEAIKLCYASTLALPLISCGRILGALCVCAREPDAFDSNEVRMLEELADDLAYGIVAIRTRSKHEQAVEALEESEKKYSNLVEQGNDGIVVIQDEKVQFANSKMAELTGYRLEEALGKPFISFVAPDYEKLILEKYKKKAGGRRLIIDMRSS